MVNSELGCYLAHDHHHNSYGSVACGYTSFRAGSAAGRCNKCVPPIQGLGLEPHTSPPSLGWRSPECIDWRKSGAHLSNLERWPNCSNRAGRVLLSLIKRIVFSCLASLPWVSGIPMWWLSQTEPRLELDRICESRLMSLFKGAATRLPVCYIRPGLT